MISADNTVLFQFLKKNSNYIKDKIISVEIFRNLTSTVIRDFDYKKPEVSKDEYCSNNENETKKIIDIIGSRRARQQEVFFNHYRNNGNILSNSILLADVIHEFMKSRIDTLLLPFVGDTKYCYNIMDTQWCQIQSIDLFLFPTIVRLSDYNPELSTSEYLFLKRSTELTICGNDGVLFNLLFENGENSNKTYYLFVYENEAFISTGQLITSG
tara:strand:+ start:63 stop:701 length:639 start_codon:yes stop_codon:yes gene_type:complete